MLLLNPWAEQGDDVEAARQHVLHCMEIWGGNQAADRSVSTPGLDLWVYSQPYEGAEGGGDVHYVSLCGGGSITRLLLADVSGHGAPVAGLAASLRELMRANINSPDQTRLVRALNRQFGELAKPSGFATALVATYLTRGDGLTVCNAGHPRPLWYRAAAGAWSFLTHEGGPAGEVADLPLGIVEETAYTELVVPLGRGDLVLFYTDALTEAENAGGEQIGEAGLLGLVRRLDAADPAGMTAALLAGLQDYGGGKAAADDVTFILLHHNAGPRRQPGLLETLDVYAKVLRLKSV